MVYLVLAGVSWVETVEGVTPGWNRLSQLAHAKTLKKKNW